MKRNDFTLEEMQAAWGALDERLGGSEATRIVSRGGLRHTYVTWPGRWRRMMLVAVLLAVPLMVLLVLAARARVYDWLDAVPLVVAVGALLYVVAGGVATWMALQRREPHRVGAAELTVRPIMPLRWRLPQALSVVAIVLLLLLATPAYAGRSVQGCSLGERQEVVASVKVMLNASLVKP